MVHLIVDIVLNATGQFEGTIGSDPKSRTAFFGTLELLKLLQDATKDDVVAGRTVVQSSQSDADG